LWSIEPSIPCWFCREFPKVWNICYLIVPISRRGPTVCRGECKKTGSIRSEKCFRELFNDSRLARSNYLRDSQVILGVKAERDWTMGRFLSHYDFAKFREVLVCSRNWIYSSPNSFEILRREIFRVRDLYPGNSTLWNLKI